MSQSAKFQEEICNQWLECENDEIDYYRKHFGDNPTSFKGIYTCGEKHLGRNEESCMRSSESLHGRWVQL